VANQSAVTSRRIERAQRWVSTSQRVANVKLAVA
jgi:hypothetical protein